MRYVARRFPEPRRLADVIRADGRAGVLLLRVRSPLREGTPLLVEVGTHGLTRPVLLRGVVAAQLGDGRVAEVALAESEREKRDFLLALARGVSFRERRCPARRFPIRAPVEVVHGARRMVVAAELTEVSERGARIVTGVALAPDVVVELRLPQKGTAVLGNISCHVAWMRETVEAVGYGVAFHARDGSGALRESELVRRLVLAQLETAGKTRALNLCSR